jgi:DNA-binding beta-propeller fold protein YncE
MNVSKFARLAFGLSILLLGAYALTVSAQSGYHLVKKVSLAVAPGGGQYFDYILVDPEARRVYVSHGTEVDVLDADKYTLLGTISDPGFKRVHGVALVKSLGKGFISDGDAMTAWVFDIKTMKVTGEVKTNQPDTDSIIYDPASKYVFTFNGNSHNTTVIDPAKEAVIKNIDLVGAVEFPAVDGKGMIYDNNEEKNDVVAIDTKTLMIKARWPTAPSGQAVALAIDAKNRRLFSAGRNPQMLVIMDADKGNVIQSFPITAGVDAIQFDPGTGMVSVSTREGFIHVYHEDTPDKFTEVEKIKTEYGAKTMGLDTKTHTLYLSTSDFDPPAAPSAKQPNPLPRANPSNFRILVYAR